MATISFLFGSGFSRPEGLPTVGELNVRMGKIDASEILIHTDFQAMFLDGQEDLNKHNQHESLFLQEFLEFYNNEVLKENEDFHYETFYDFYSGYIREGKNKDQIERYYNLYNDKYFKGADKTIDCSNRIIEFNRTFNQLLGSRLHKIRYMQDKGFSNYNLYKSFLGFLQGLLKNNDIKIHTLNHDTFFDWIGRNHSDLSSEFSDGFELGGSPIYGKVNFDFNHYNQIVHKDYKVKLEHFTNRFDTKLCLYKLHGSINNTILYREQNERILIKSNYPVSYYYEEFYNEEKRKYEFRRLLDDVSPNFLSGTTEKILRYGEEDHYIKLFKHFESNLRESSVLIVVGYGFQDSGINEYLIKDFLKEGKKMIVIDPNKPKSEIIDEYNVDFIPQSVTDVSYQKYIEMIPKEFY